MGLVVYSYWELQVGDSRALNQAQVLSNTKARWDSMGCACEAGPARPGWCLASSRASTNECLFFFFLLPFSLKIWCNEMRQIVTTGWTKGSRAVELLLMLTIQANYPVCELFRYLSCLSSSLSYVSADNSKINCSIPPFFSCTLTNGHWGKKKVVETTGSHIWTKTPSAIGSWCTPIYIYWLPSIGRENRQFPRKGPGISLDPGSCKRQKPNQLVEAKEELIGLLDSEVWWSSSGIAGSRSTNIMISPTWWPWTKMPWLASPGHVSTSAVRGDVGHHS